jgi:hypothetical protein
MYPKLAASGTAARMRPAVHGLVAARAVARGAPGSPLTVPGVDRREQRNRQCQPQATLSGRGPISDLAGRRWLGGERKLDMNGRACLGCALDGDAAPQSLDAVLEANEARPAREVCAADAVIANADA